MNDDAELMVEYLVSLQFYSDDDEFIYSRDKKYRIHILGIRPSVQSFISQLVSPINLIRQSRYREYLEQIRETLEFDIDEVWGEFKDNISDLSDHDLSMELVVNFLVGPIRSNIQQREFNRLIENLKSSLLLDLDDSASKSKIQSALEDAFARNDESVSMLYSLSFLRYIVTEFGNDDILEDTERYISSYTRKLKAKLKNGIVTLSKEGDSI